ncbi:MAG: GNAT family acetyltransferase [Verrucomicrobiota bacterium]|nr:GNAT family acetyltransferase [Verrucomicrobiota bacterium]
MLIRRFRDTDRAALIALWARCGLIRPVNDPNKDIDRKLATQPDLLLVGERAGRLIAAVMVGYDGHRGWVNYLGVDPDLQKQGYGRQLMAEVERVLRERGCPKINLQILETNAKVQGFYERLGFTRDPVIQMGKRLVVDS